MINHTYVDVLPIQAAVATATPRTWRDGLVTHQEPGALTVTLLDGATTVTLVTRAALDVGEPVAVHAVAEVVAAGATWYAARPVAEPL